jgi:GTP-dependent phosphoenolpyruvate carboxykinase
VVNKDGLSVMIFEDKHQAQTDHPELRLETDNIEEVYQKVSTRCPELLHPNLDKVTLRPCRAKEFALIDGQIGIRLMQW